MQGKLENWNLTERTCLNMIKSGVWWEKVEKNGVWQ